MNQTKSLRKSIDNMCKACIYDEAGGGGTWKQQTQNCTAPQCPLFCQRPLQAGYEHHWDKDEYLGVRLKPKGEGHEQPEWLKKR